MVWVFVKLMPGGLRLGFGYAWFQCCPVLHMTLLSMTQICALWFLVGFEILMISILMCFMVHSFAEFCLEVLFFSDDWLIFAGVIYILGD